PGIGPRPLGDHRLHPRPAPEPAWQFGGGARWPGSGTVVVANVECFSMNQAEPTRKNPCQSLQRWALIVGSLCLVSCILGSLWDAAQFFRSYLIAFTFWLGIGLGSLAVLMIH